MLSYIERDGDKIKYIALYDYKGRILAISIGTCFNDQLYPVDVLHFQQLDPQLFSYIQNKVNESLDQTPHLNS